jgi:hypothetical protein
MLFRRPPRADDERVVKGARLERLAEEVRSTDRQIRRMTTEAQLGSYRDVRIGR